MRKRILASLLALAMVFTIMPVTAFAEETDINQEMGQIAEPDDASDTVAALPETQAQSWEFMNDGYPYGKNMSNNSVTLVMDIEGTADSYQWQSASSKNGDYTDVSGETATSYTIQNPDNGTWYRCLVDGKESKAVEVVYPGRDGRTWTKPYSSLYISNGTMAYMANGTLFDVTGLYTKNGTDYMLCTSYGMKWDMFSDTSPTPSAGSTNGASLDALRVAFNEKDAYDVIFEADLASGQQSFSFGCDTQLGNTDTSGNYNDYAALQALLKNKKLQQISMIGAASVKSAQDEDPAFVIAPVTDNSMFWIGHYSSRQTYTYNQKENGNSNNVQKYEYVNDTTEAATLFESGDSGMTMSWTNLPSGSSVKFRFGVGSVKDTGAINGKVDYENEKLTGLDPNTVYLITVNGEDTTYTLRSDSEGEIALSGTDNSGKNYDFIGKKIKVAKNGSDDKPADIEVSGRPDKPQNPSDLDNGSSDKPQIVEKIEIAELTTNSVKISPIEGQQYAYSTDGTSWTVLKDTDKDSNGYYNVKGLTDGSKVYIKTRISATKDEPASE